MQKWMPEAWHFHTFTKYVKLHEITLPLDWEHDFTVSEYLELHQKTIRNAYKIDARKSCAKAMENRRKMELKGEPKSIQSRRNASKFVANPNPPNHIGKKEPGDAPEE